MAKRLKSIFTDNMDICIFTGSPYVERHHVFSGANRKKCEKYGFTAPIRYDLHPNGAGFSHSSEIREQINNYLQTKCQEWYEAHIGTRADFIREFGKSYL